MSYALVKWLHILSSTFLFGTGVGSAFYLLTVSLSRDARATAVVARRVVWADWLFTSTTVVFQPLSGLYLLHMMNLPLSTPWVRWSLVGFGLAVACWLPVVVLQIRMHRLADEAVRHGRPLPPAYWRRLRWWVALGFPALFAFLWVFWLMVAKPMT